MTRASAGTNPVEYFRTVSGAPRGPSAFARTVAEVSIVNSGGGPAEIVRTAAEDVFALLPFLPFRFLRNLLM